MAFKKFKTISDVAIQYEIRLSKGSFLADFDKVSMPSLLKSELQYITHNYPYTISEAAIRETILFPILKEVWKKYDQQLMLWANKSIRYDKSLSGMPDYLLAKQSHLGKLVFGKPLMAVIEAKKDDFEGGWAQCLLEMYTIQKINAQHDLAVYGIVTNGDVWQFGQLLRNDFTEEQILYTLSDMDELYAVLSHFFELCDKQAQQL